MNRLNEWLGPMFCRRWFGVRDVSATLVRL